MNGMRMHTDNGRRRVAQRPGRPGFDGHDDRRERGGPQNRIRPEVRDGGRERPDGPRGGRHGFDGRGRSDSPRDLDRRSRLERTRGESRPSGRTGLDFREQPGTPRRRRRPAGPCGRRGSGRARRGDVRAAALALVAERPMHGYEMIRELEARTGGAWRPSPGAMYPALRHLQDEGLIDVDESSGKRLHGLTEAGRLAQSAVGDFARPWEDIAAGVPPIHKLLADGVGQIGTAIEQITESGTADHKSAAAQILADARKAVYKLLADGE